MGRFERDIRKKIEESDQPFNEWFAERQDRLTDFEPPEEPASDLGPVRVRRRTYAWLTGAIAVLLVAFVVTAVFLFRGQPQSQPQIPDLSFGEEGVYMEDLSDEEYQEVLKTVPTLDDLLYPERRKICCIEDNSVAMVTLSGIQVMNNSLYSVEARISYNENYIFPEKMYYEGLDEERDVGNMHISYAESGVDSHHWTKYRILSENEDTTIYWIVSSSNGTIEEWLQLTFGN